MILIWWGGGVGQVMAMATRGWEWLRGEWLSQWWWGCAHWCCCVLWNNRAAWNVHVRTISHKVCCNSAFLRSEQDWLNERRKVCYRNGLCSGHQNYETCVLYTERWMWNFKPQTEDPKLQMPNLKPYTSNPKFQTFVLEFEIPMWCYYDVNVIVLYYIVLYYIVWYILYYIALYCICVVLYMHTVVSCTFMLHRIIIL